MMQQRQARLAIFIWGGVGNAVMALPMLNAARRAKGDENVILVLPRLGWACLVQKPGSLRAVYDIKQILARPAKADIALPSLPYPRWRYGLAALASGAKSRVADASLANPLLNRMTVTEKRGNHWVERNLALLGALGIDCAEAKFDIPIDSKAMAMAERFLIDSGHKAGDRLIGLHPGSGNPMRRWPEENFIRLGRALSSEGSRAVVFGGPGEQDLAGRVASGIGSQAVSFCGKLDEALALISRCRAFVAADSGLAHCSAALGVPTMALMGPSDERQYRPYGPKVVILVGRADCRPCYRPGRAIRCPHERRMCLDIGVDEALQGLRKLG